jgi:hypothetical protein
MVLVKLANRLIDRLVPKVDAHAVGNCYWGSVNCACVGGFYRRKVCFVCDTGSLSCSPCGIVTTIPC